MINKDAIAKEIENISRVILEIELAAAMEDKTLPIKTKVGFSVALGHLKSARATLAGIKIKEPA